MVVSNNAGWLIGDGSSVDFWNARWCGEPIFQTLNINQNVAFMLSAKVQDFIVHG